jgi:hypothetical protein
MQCRNNNDDHNNSCDQNNSIIFCIQHEGKHSLQIYPPFQKQRTFSLNLEMDDNNVYSSIVQKSIYRKQTLDGVQEVQKSLRH